MVLTLDSIRFCDSDIFEYHVIYNFLAIWDLWVEGDKNLPTLWLGKAVSEVDLYILSRVIFVSVISSKRESEILGKIRGKT